MKNEKQIVALSSVIAAVFLTVVKLIVGLFTGSLGILSEVAHSALDLGAAIVTFFAVRISDKPADKEHNFGHGKVENFSALVETLLLLATCGWIIYEAIDRLMGKSSIEIDNSLWGILVMGIAIIINVSRSKVLKKAARKYGSQALEADALHFDSDVWSSYVVIGGLILVWLGKVSNIKLLEYGDPLAALGVAVLVIIVSCRLGKRTIDALLDTAPKGVAEKVTEIVKRIEGVLEVGSVRVRPCGAHYFIDLNVGISRNESHRVVHTIVHNIREQIQDNYPDSDVVIGTFPINLAEENNEIYNTVKNVVDRFANCTNIHNIHVYEIGGRKNIAIHIEVKEAISLSKSHEVSHMIEDEVKAHICDVENVSVEFEYVRRAFSEASDVTLESTEIIDSIENMLNKVPDRLNCHDIKVYKNSNGIVLFLHCGLASDYTTDRIEKITHSITNKIKKNVPNILNVHLHIEPINDKVT